MPTLDEQEKLRREQFLKSLEKQHSLPEGTLLFTKTNETGADLLRGEDLVSPTGATGPFQFTKRTAKEFGIEGKNDFYTQAKAAAELATRNAKALKEAGLPVTSESIYLAHQQGATGAIKILRNKITPDISSNMSKNRGAGLSREDFLKEHGLNKLADFEPDRVIEADTLDEFLKKRNYFKGALNHSNHPKEREIFKVEVNTPSFSRDLNTAYEDKLSSVEARQAALESTIQQAGLGPEDLKKATTDFRAALELEKSAREAQLDFYRNQGSTGKEFAANLFSFTFGDPLESAVKAAKANTDALIRGNAEFARQAERIRKSIPEDKTKDIEISRIKDLDNQDYKNAQIDQMLENSLARAEAKAKQENNSEILGNVVKKELGLPKELSSEEAIAVYEVRKATGTLKQKPKEVGNESEFLDNSTAKDVITKHIESDKVFPEDLLKDRKVKPVIQNFRKGKVTLEDLQVLAESTPLTPNNVIALRNYTQAQKSDTRKSAFLAPINSEEAPPPYSVLNADAVIPTENEAFTAWQEGLHNPSPEAIALQAVKTFPDDIDKAAEAVADWYSGLQKQYNSSLLVEKKVAQPLREVTITLPSHFFKGLKEIKIDPTEPGEAKILIMRAKRNAN